MKRKSKKLKRNWPTVPTGKTAHDFMLRFIAIERAADDATKKGAIEASEYLKKILGAISRARHEDSGTQFNVKAAKAVWEALELNLIPTNPPGLLAIDLDEVFLEMHAHMLNGKKRHAAAKAAYDLHSGKLPKSKAKRPWQVLEKHYAEWIRMQQYDAGRPDPDAPNWLRWLERHKAGYIDCP